MPGFPSSERQLPASGAGHGSEGSGELRTCAQCAGELLSPVLRATRGPLQTPVLWGPSQKQPDKGQACPACPRPLSLYG